MKSVNDLCMSSVICNRLHIPSYLYDVQLCTTAWLALNSMICFGELNSLVKLSREHVFVPSSLGMQAYPDLDTCPHYARWAAGRASMPAGR